MKIVFLDASTMGDTSLDELRELGELKFYDNSTPEEAMTRVKDCEVLIVNKIDVTKELIDSASHLHLICEAATGTNNIDLAYAESKGIPVRNVAGYSTDSVAQLTFMHILSLVGNAPYFDASVKSGEYSRSGMFTDVTVPIHELAGKNMGIIGMGNIGKRVAHIAEAFGMKVSYFSTSGTGHCTDYPSVPLDTLMRESDVISVHAPFNVRTANLISARELSLMKADAIIINMGRGGIVNEADLAEAIDKNLIGGAALDVFEVEPLPSDNPLLHTSHPEKLRFTPHTGWASSEARARLVHLVAENIRKGW